MTRPTAPPGDYVLRALGASEIAESCNNPVLRDRFLWLTELWLTEAERAAKPANDTEI